MKATGIPRFASRRAVAIRRPGCTASRISPIFGPSSSAQRSRSPTANVTPQNAAGPSGARAFSTTSQITSPRRKNPWRTGGPGSSGSRMRRRPTPAPSNAAIVRFSCGVKTTRWSIRMAVLGWRAAVSRRSGPAASVGRPSSSVPSAPLSAQPAMPPLPPASSMRTEPTRSAPSAPTSNPQPAHASGSAAIRRAEIRTALATRPSPRRRRCHPTRRWWRYGRSLPLPSRRACA